MTGPATKRFILCFGSMTCFASLLEVTNKSHRLVPTFRSSYTISAITFYELRKAMGTSKFMLLVPLFDLKSLGSFRRLRCRDFKSAALVPTFRSSYTISAITFNELRKAMGTSKFMILVPPFDLKSLGSFRRLRYRDFKSAALVPTFRSSYTISAITFNELRKAMGTSKFMILVPPFDLKSLGSFRRLRCRDFNRRH